MVQALLNLMVNTYTGIHKGAYTIAHKGTCTVNVTHKGIHIIRHQGAYYVLLRLTVYVVMLIQYRVNYAHYKATAGAVTAKSL